MFRVHTPAGSDENAPTILYLPSGLATHPDPPSSVEQLGLGSNANVVKINYKATKEDAYPFPIHSVLAGFDWARHNSCRVKDHKQIGDGSGSPNRRMGVCGQFLGGSLATMLALTECHHHAGIVAATVANPIVDWTTLDVALGIEDPVKKKKRVNKPSGSDQFSQTSPRDEDLRDALLSLRKSCFSKPEKYFDPFASPLLFFRTPRFAIVPVDPSSEEDESQVDEPSDAEGRLGLVQRRLSHRTYPPMGSDLLLPRLRVEAGETSPLKDEAVEIIQLMERSIGKSKLPHTIAADGRFEVEIRDGIGSWDENDFHRIGQWLGRELRRS